MFIVEYELIYPKDPHQDEKIVEARISEDSGGRLVTLGECFDGECDSVALTVHRENLFRDFVPARALYQGLRETIDNILTEDEDFWELADGDDTEVEIEATEVTKDDRLDIICD